MNNILWVSPDPPWSQWSNSGFIRSICLEIKRRGRLFGAFSPKEDSLRSVAGPGIAYDLRNQIGRKLLFKSGVGSKKLNCDESQGLLKMLLQQLPTNSIVVYQYMYPKIDTSLPLRRILFQDMTVRDAVETSSYGHDRLTPAQVAEMVEAQRVAVHAADGIVTFSTYAAESIAKEYGLPRERLVAIGAGPVRAPKHVNFDESRYAEGNLLFVGRQWERKGGPLLLKAFQIVRRAVPHATLTIAGAKIVPPDQVGVNYLGHVSNRQIAQLFARSSIFSMPARCETWGLVYTEAAASGLPIVGFNAWAMPDIVKNGQSGILIDDQTPEALAAALIDLLENPKRLLEMGKAARAYALDVLDWPHVVDRLFRGFLPEALNDRQPRWMQ